MNSLACVYWAIGTITAPEWLTGAGEFMAGVGGLATATAVFVFGILGLRHYQEAQRLKAAEMLLEMEKEYREVLPVCIEFELQGTYESLIKPMLIMLTNKTLGEGDLTEIQRSKLKELDRALRFFYTCSVLNGELKVEVRRGLLPEVARMAQEAQRKSCQIQRDRKVVSPGLSASLGWRLICLLRVKQKMNCLQTLLS